jgi:hypothetical protein
MSNQSNARFNTYTFNLIELPNRNTVMIVTIMAQTQTTAWRVLFNCWSVKPNFTWVPIGEISRYWSGYGIE